VVREEGDLYGAAVIAATRINDKAKAGQILISETVRGVIGHSEDIELRDVGEFPLKGFPDKWRLFEVDWRRNAPIEAGPSVGLGVGSRSTSTGQDDDEIPLIGRSAEVEFLDAALRDVQAGHSRQLLIDGDPGVGKTSLLREAPRIFKGKAAIVTGHCYEFSEVPYLPFAEAVRSCVLQYPESLKALEPAESSLIRRLLGKEVADWQPGSASAGSERSRLSFAIQQLLVNVSRERPLVLFIEDIHWIDGPSLDVLTSTLFALADEALGEGIPIFVACTYRTDEVGPSLRSAIDRLERDGRCRRLSLRGLGEPELGELIERITGGRPSQQLISTVAQATRGNPLFARVAVENLVDRGALVERSGSLVSTLDPDELNLPDQLTEAVRARIDSLATDVRSILELAASLGDIFNPDILLAVAEPEREPAIAALDEAVRQRLLANEGASLRFAHPLIRHVVYQSISVTRQQSLHGRIADALQRMSEDDVDAHILEIAEHLRRSGGLADSSEVIEYSRRAAEQAMRVFAWGEAARFFSAAADRAVDSATFSPRDVAELEYLAALAHFRNMDPALVLDRLGRAIESFGAAGDAHGVLLAEVLDARTHMTIGDLPVGTMMDVEPLMTAIDAVEEDEVGLRGQGLWQLSQCYWHARRFDEAVEMAESALSAGREVGDERLCCEALTTRGLIRFSSIELDAAVDDFAESAEIARSVGDPWLASHPLPRLCPALISLGRLDEAWSAVDEACRITAEVSDWAEYSFALAYKVTKSYLGGDFPAVERLSSEGLAAARRSGYVWGPAVFLPTLACARLARGLYEDAEDALTLLVEPGAITDEPDFQFLTLALAFRILILAAVDDRETSSQLLSLVRAQLQGQLRHDIHPLSAYCAVAEAAYSHGETDLLEAVAEPLQFARDRGVVICSSGGFLLPRVLGRIRAGLGDFRGAEAHFQEALDIAERWELRPNIALTSLNYAEMLADHGKSNDRERAAALILRSAEISEELGMDFFVQRARSVGTSLATAVPRATQPTKVYPDGLTGRELEVLRLIAEGRTNQQIADELVLSIRTVHRHASNIFTKINVTNRAGATAYAFDKRLVSSI
jgi:DNA-binding CsgD family transcriptional regulator/tetratricopeptide (TPR) repeat protein